MNLGKSSFFPTSSAAARKTTIKKAAHAGLETTSDAMTLVLLHDSVLVGDLHLTLSSRWLKNYHEKSGDRAQGFSCFESDNVRISPLAHAASRTSGALGALPPPYRTRIRTGTLISRQQWPTGKSATGGAQRPVASSESCGSR